MAISSIERPVVSNPLGLSAVRLVALVGAAGASATTLVWDGSFPDPSPLSTGPNIVRAEAWGWSLVTLALVVPLGLAALHLARRGSLSARLTLAGVMAYLFYTYLELAVAPPYTPLYLLYILVFACAVVALVYDIATIDHRALTLRSRAPRRSVAWFGFAFASGLALAWSRAIATDLAAGHAGWPTGAAAVGHVVHALDLGLYVPLGVATGISLLAKRPGAHMLGTISLVIGVCMGTALCAMVASALMASGESVVGALPFALIPASASVLSWFWLREL